MMNDMKTLFRYFSLALVAAAALSCMKDNVLPEPVTGDGAIMLDVSSIPHTKMLTDADLASVGAEAYVKHIDLYIFGEQADGGPSVYHQRLSYANPANPDTKVLSKKKTMFKSGESYKVYAVANSTAAADDMAAITGVSGLESLVQTDEFIHFTGLNQENVPDVFLMDASVDIVLNPAGKEAENTVIDIKLTRAAAKILIELFEGEDISFQSPDNAHVYHFRNLPYSTSVLNGVAHTPSVRSTQPHQVNDYVKWNPDEEGSFTVSGSEITVVGTPQISITGYVYAYDYSSSPADKHTSLVVNVPLKMQEGSTVKDYPSNYYKIPLTNGLKIEKNRMYRIRAAVRAPGAQTSYDPIELENLSYDVIAWNDYMPPIQIGGDVNKPKYLQLNIDHIDMFNVNEDNTSLTFASSSKITSVELLRAYYFNKHGVETNVPTEIRNSISASAEEEVLNGSISIFSPIVASSEADRAAMEQELLENMGLVSPPLQPSDIPQNPVLDIVTEPDPAGYLPEDTYRYTYSYEGTGKDVVFYRTSNYYPNTKTVYSSVQSAYDRDYAAYEYYMENWGSLTDAQRQAKIYEYQQKLLEYQAMNAVYAEWKAEYDKIQATAEPTHYNTVRHLEFKVTNEQGLERTFTVSQYPVIYITNSLGWYSYRKDFKTGANAPTTYENRGSRIVSVSLSFSGTGEYDWTNNYSTSRGSGYWYSKVRTGTNTTGTTRYSSYGWDNNASNPTVSSSYNQSSTNLRMYHVNVTTTSGDYVVGRPKMVYNPTLGLNVTDPSAENSKLVSPSFMIASRLGFFTTDGGNIDDANDAQRLNIFRVHCANYVEVHGDASNKTVYDNWRLPTEAELKIIMDVQGASGENAAAVDYLLNAGYYFGAAGPVWNSKNDDDIPSTANPAGYDSKSVRCVRDAY